MADDRFITQIVATHSQREAALADEALNQLADGPAKELLVRLATGLHFGDSADVALIIREAGRAKH